jgi:5-methyltetrahydropteroyltriglutamate--homocysteine methyltransferase
MPPFYRADHLGSFLRPPEILAARADPAIVPEQLRQLEDRHVLRILEQQRDAGLRIFTDGEIRRQHFMSDFYDSVEGVDRDGSVVRAWTGQSGASGSPVAMVPGLVVDRIRGRKRLTGHEVSFLKEHSPGDIKITVPSANQFPAIMYRRGISDRVYPTPSDFLWDVVPIIKAEIEALAREGIRYIQIDAPRYSYFIDPTWRNYLEREMGIDPDRGLEEAVRADNACLSGVPRGDATLAIHLCRGNNRSQWYATGGYDAVAEQLFNGLDVDTFLLEYETERAGTFDPLRFVPAGKRVVLGLVSSKLPALESPDDLMRRVDEAGRFVPLERLALSPQCGFASSMEGNLMTEAEQWRKLRLVVETAQRIWGDAAPA